MANPEKIERRQILKTTLPEKTVRSVDIRSITLAPGQATGLHRHPCPVLCYITEGSALVQIDGEDTHVFGAGSAVYEPAGAKILHFDNASKTESLTFIAFYLLSANEPLIEMLA